MKQYRAVVKCGIGFDSLEIDYEKKWNIVVVDNNPDVSEPSDIETRLHLREQTAKRYQMECKHCGKMISLPYLDDHISTDTYAHASFNKSNFSHDVRVISTDPVIKESDDVVDVSSDPSVILISNGFDRGAHHERSELEWAKFKRTELFFKIIIGLLILNAILKLGDVILKLNHL